jgi:RNA polymerase sigma factor (sigma-70 family)
LKEQSNQFYDESDLLRGCLNGDRRAQESLYKQYSGKMYAVCLRYAKDADEAQDILQEGFIKVFNSLEKFRNEGSFEGWIRRIFVNTSIEQYRKAHNKQHFVDSEELEVEDKAITAMSKLAEKDVIMLIQQLSPGYRQVFNMYVIEGFSHKEIADVLGINEGTSKSQLARAKQMLQKKIESIY